MRHKTPPMTKRQIDALTPFLDIFTHLGTVHTCQRPK